MKSVPLPRIGMRVVKTAVAVMTFPAIIEATQTPISGAAALAAGILAAWCGAGLFPVSVICCVLVFVIELFV